MSDHRTLPLFIHQCRAAPRPSRTPSAARSPHRFNGEHQLDCCVAGHTACHRVEVQETVNQDGCRTLVGAEPGLIFAQAKAARGCLAHEVRPLTRCGVTRTRSS